ncbi:hypothetical protein [Phytohabitans aurantiacus]|nr:hypothetical protein [Phytohabitans aurantiacus]
MADEDFVLEWHGDEILAALKGASFEGLELAGEHLLQVSSDLAPHEEGELERSGDISKDEADGAVAVYFDRPYAAVQHEDLTFRHDEGKQAKYLEEPMGTEADTMIALIAEAAGEPLEG